MTCKGDTSYIDSVKDQWNIVLNILTPTVYVTAMLLMCYTKRLDEHTAESIGFASYMIMIMGTVFFPCLYYAVRPAHIKSLWELVIVNRVSAVTRTGFRCCAKVCTYGCCSTRCSNFCKEVTSWFNVTQPNTTEICMFERIKNCLDNRCVNGVLNDQGIYYAYANPYDFRVINKNVSFVDTNGLVSSVFAGISGVAILCLYIYICVLLQTKAQRKTLPRCTRLAGFIPLDTISIKTVETTVSA